MVQPLGTRDNILFDTAWNKAAKLGDLENDNLVVPDVADGLCAGILDKAPIEKSLKPWLHGNPMPIAGVVIAATGERLSIKSGINGHPRSRVRKCRSKYNRLVIPEYRTLSIKILSKMALVLHCWKHKQQMDSLLMLSVQMETQ